uniref:(California timema) hypothetical protein n=1 Tax=Timema californicum TaxID=61474 RepID=A0A7R9J9X4_TIMCA|nr:unnamed protein product [Timema californicum]
MDCVEENVDCSLEETRSAGGASDSGKKNAGGISILLLMLTWTLLGAPPEPVLSLGCSDAGCFLIVRGRALMMGNGSQFPPTPPVRLWLPSVASSGGSEAGRGGGSSGSLLWIEDPLKSTCWWEPGFESRAESVSGEVSVSRALLVWAEERACPLDSPDWCTTRVCSGGWTNFVEGTVHLASPSGFPSSPIPTSIELAEWWWSGGRVVKEMWRLQTLTWWPTEEPLLLLVAREDVEEVEEEDPPTGWPRVKPGWISTQGLQQSFEIVTSTFNGKPCLPGYINKSLASAHKPLEHIIVIIFGCFKCITVPSRVPIKILFVCPNFGPCRRDKVDREFGVVPVVDSCIVPGAYQLGVEVVLRQDHLVVLQMMPVFLAVGHGDVVQPLPMQPVLKLRDPLVDVGHLLLFLRQHLSLLGQTGVLLLIELVAILEHTDISWRLLLLLSDQ